MTSRQSEPEPGWPCSRTTELVSSPTHPVWSPQRLFHVSARVAPVKAGACRRAVAVAGGRLLRYCPRLSKMAAGVVRMMARSSEASSCGLMSRLPGLALALDGARPDQVRLELGHQGEHPEEHFANRVPRVVNAPTDAELDPLAGKLGGDVVQVAS